MKYDITHITVHMGGGIGSVLLNWVNTDKNNRHRILCLNYNYYRKYDNILENMRTDRIKIAEHIAKSDIVVVHFWNHPYLFEYLIEADIPDCRMAIWSHMSGLNAPYVFSEKLIRFSDRIVFASPISYKAKEIEELPSDLFNKLGYIWTTGNIEEFFDVKPVPHNGFNIGFVGTLDYSKLHPNFVDICSKINIPNVMFIMIGGGCDVEKIKQEVKDKGLESKFLFTGVIEDVKPYLSMIDVFGYPLNPDHFGTCEQVLGEAIAAGVIPIVMRNPAEEYILLQSLVKFVCKDENEYIHNIELLYRDKDKRESIIDFMKDHVVKLYDSGKMVQSWQTVFDQMMKKDKRKRAWAISDEKVKMRGAGFFLESLGNYSKAFENDNIEEILRLYKSNLQWYSEGKGSPKQYLEAFPNDKRLAKWVELLVEGK